MLQAAAPRRGRQKWTLVFTGLMSADVAHSVPIFSPNDADNHQCSASCDKQGRCMPLRFVWGAQKGGTTGLWDMLHRHFVCGANRRFGRLDPDDSQLEVKESHYLASVGKTASRVAYTETFLLAECASHCFVDATPDNLMVPLAAARLYSVMSSAEVVRFRRRPRLASAGSWLHRPSSASARSHALPPSTSIPTPGYTHLLRRSGRGS
jgi:hypothetical protein